ncbi:MAG: hypothetical protein ACK5XX_07975 [Holosporales bacterium]
MRFFLALLILTTALLATAANAQTRLRAPTDSKWRGSFLAGYDFTVSGNVLSRAEGSILGLPTTTNGVKWGDAYGTPLAFGFDFAYANTQLTEIFGRITLTQADGKSLTIGESGGIPLLAEFDSYSEFGILGGYRWYFPEASQFRLLTPYAGAFFGLKYVAAVNADISAPAAPFAFNNQELYSSGFIPSVGFNIGLLYPTTSNFALGIETGLTYQLSPKSGETDFNGSATGLEKLSSGGGKIIIPVTFRATLKM